MDYTIFINKVGIANRELTPWWTCVRTWTTILCAVFYLNLINVISATFDKKNNALIITSKVICVIALAGW